MDVYMAPNGKYYVAEAPVTTGCCKLPFASDEFKAVLNGVPKSAEEVGILLKKTTTFSR